MSRSQRCGEGPCALIIYGGENGFFLALVFILELESIRDVMLTSNSAESVASCMRIPIIPIDNMKANQGESSLQTSEYIGHIEAIISAVFRGGFLHWSFRI